MLRSRQPDATEEEKKIGETRANEVRNRSFKSVIIGYIFMFFEVLLAKLITMLNMFGYAHIKFIW